MIVRTPNYPRITVHLVTFFAQNPDRGDLIPNSSDPKLLTEAELAELLKKSEDGLSAFLVTPLRLTIDAGLDTARNPFISPSGLLHSLDLSHDLQRQSLYFPGGRIMALSEFLDLPEYRAEIEGSSDQDMTRSHLLQRVGDVPVTTQIILPQAYDGRMSIPVLQRSFPTAQMI